MSDTYQPVITKTGNERGLSGPDYAIVELRNGKVLEVGDDGVNVYDSIQHFQSGELARQGIVFRPPNADLSDRAGRGGRA